MTSAVTGNSESAVRPMHWGFIVLMVANIAVDRWKPGSIAATLVSYTFIGSITTWFGLRIRAGYLRRRPYWTRESWLRYLRFAAMPVAAVVIVLTMSTESGIRVMRSAPSTMRVVSAGILVVLLLLAAVGLGIVVSWMLDGAPSEQFTRTRWIQRRRSSAA